MFAFVAKSVVRLQEETDDSFVCFSGFVFFPLLLIIAPTHAIINRFFVFVLSRLS